MAETHLRQAQLNASIEGIVSENNLELTSENGVDHIKGNLIVQTSDVNFITVNANQYSKKKKNDKFTDEVNKVFAGLKTVMEQYKSIAKYGRDEATKVRVQGDINLYGYYGRDGVLHEGIGYKSSFFNRVKEDEYEPHATYTAEMYIESMYPEVDREGEETGRLIVKGWSPTYSGIGKIEMIAPNDIAGDVADAYSKGETVTFDGEIVNSKVVTEKVIPRKIGKPKKEIHTKYKNELIITGASDAAPEGKAYDSDAIQLAIQEYKNYLEETKNRSANSSSGSPSTAGFKKPASSGRSLPNF